VKNSEWFESQPIMQCSYQISCIQR